MKLGTGSMRIDHAGGRTSWYFVDGGVAQMKDNRLTVLTTEATVPAEIDADAARAEFNEATARKIADEKSFQERQRALQRGRIKQMLASRQ